MRLYDMTEQYNDLLELLQDDADNEALQAMLNGLEGKIEEKIENYVKVMKSIEANAEAIDNEIKRLSARKAVLVKNAASLKQTVESTMRNFNIDKVKGTIHTIGFKKNPPKLNVLDETLIDESYFVTKTDRALDKRRLLEDLKNENYLGFGVEIVQETSLQIK